MSDGEEGDKADTAEGGKQPAAPQQAAPHWGGGIPSFRGAGSFLTRSEMTISPSTAELLREIIREEVRRVCHLFHFHFYFLTNNADPSAHLAFLHCPPFFPLLQNAP